MKAGIPERKVLTDVDWDSVWQYIRGCMIGFGQSHLLSKRTECKRGDSVQIYYRTYVL